MTDQSGAGTAGRPAAGWSDPTGAFGSADTGWGLPAPAGGWDDPAADRAPQPGVVPLRPLGIGELLDAAFATVQRYPGAMLGGSAAVMAVVAAAGYLALFLGLGDLLSVDPREVGRVGTATWTRAGLSLAGLAGLLWVGSGCLTALVTVTVGRAVRGSPVTLRRAWSGARPHVHRVLGLTLVIGAGYVAALALAGLVVAGAAALAPTAAAVLAALTLVGGVAGSIVLATRTAAAPAALVLETRPAGGGPPGDRPRPIGVLTALRRSWRLTRGRFPRTFAVVVVANLIGGVASSVVQVGFTLVATLLALAVGRPAPTGSGPVTAILLVTGVGYVATIVLQLAFQATVGALVYVDARIRSEDAAVDLAGPAADDTDPVSGPAG